MHTEEKQKYKIIIIDSDNEYGKSYVNKAKSLGYSIDYFQNLMDVGFVGNLSKYDVALIGENIGQLSGVEIAEYFGKILDTIPIFLISSLEKYERLPDCVKGVSPKTVCVEEMVERALKAVTLSKKACKKINKCRSNYYNHNDDTPMSLKRQ